MADFSEAEWYEKNSPSQKEDGLKLIELLAPQKGDKILDFGCGVGNLTKILADRVGPQGKVIGIDPDAERLQLAREKYSADNLEYIEGSAESIPEEDYDIIFSNHALHYCLDKDAVFKQFSVKLKKGGKLGFIASIEDEVKLFGLPEIYGQKFLKAHANFYHYTSFNEYKCIAAANNFKVKHSEVFEVKFDFNGVTDLVDFHKSHTRGEFDDSEFNIKEMKSHYGEGAFHFVYDYILVISTLLVSSSHFTLV